MAGIGKPVNIINLHRLAKALMVKAFTAEELNAMADFYSSKHGASVVSKSAIYTADHMQALTQEIQRAVQELPSTDRK